MSKIKIIQIYCYNYVIHPGGLEKIAQTLNHELNQKHDIQVLDITSDIRAKWNISYKDTISIYLPSWDLIPGFPVPKIRLPLFRQKMGDIRKYNPDIIQTHTRFFLYTLLGGILAKIRWCKWIHIEHGSGFVTGYPRYIKLAARLFDWTVGLWVFRQANNIITISRAHQKFIKKFTKKVPIIIYNPIEYLAHNKIKNRIPHIWFIGRLVPIKWVDILLEALTWLTHITRKCTIIGDWSEKNKLEELSTKLWLTKRIIFVWTDDRYNRLHKFDIFVNPSYQEGLPTTVVEALLAKCVVVATNVWGTAEISDQKDLILVNTWNVSNLKESLRFALQHYEKIRWLSYDHIKDRFDKKSSIQRYYKAYLHMIWHEK